MLSKTKIRILSVLMLTFTLGGWLWMSTGLYADYIDILNRRPEVTLSVLSLWVPVGFLGTLLSLMFLGSVAIYTGKQARLVIDAKWMKLANRVCIYFALAGIAFAAGWTYHSLDLLDRYGYVYSSDLTKFTPTGIHLVYVLAR